MGCDKVKQAVDYGYALEAMDDKDWVVLLALRAPP